MELERLTLAGDPRMRVESAEYADVLLRGGGRDLDRHRGYGRDDGCYVSRRHAGRRQR